MSKIVAFRERIMQQLRDDIPEIREVDWYDGIFDQDDIADWTIKTPAAFVAVMNAPTDHHTTGEVNADLRIVVCVIDQDSRVPRDADARVWTICEAIVQKANLNDFGDENAGRATSIKFKRLSHPMLRREGVAVGVVEWQSSLTIGTNRVTEREYIWNSGVRVAVTPANLVGQAKPYDANGSAPAEIQPLPPDNDGFSGSSVHDLGVVERELVNDEKWSPDP